MSEKTIQNLTQNASAAIAKENFDELVKFTASQLKDGTAENRSLVATALVSEITSEVAAETAAEIVAETSVMATFRGE